MKIIIKQEVGEDGSQTTCVWSVGDDGETQETEYLKGGQQVVLDVAIGAKGTEDGQVNLAEVTFGEVGPLGPVDLGSAEESSAPEGAPDTPAPNDAPINGGGDKAIDSGYGDEPAQGGEPVSS